MQPVRKPAVYVCAGIATLILASCLAFLKPTSDTPIPQTFQISTPPASTLPESTSPASECKSDDVRHQWCEPRYIKSI